jgi:hypothetical protein
MPALLSSPDATANNAAGRAHVARHPSDGDITPNPGETPSAPARPWLSSTFPRWSRRRQSRISDCPLDGFVRGATYRSQELGNISPSSDRHASPQFTPIKPPKLAFIRARPLPNEPGIRDIAGCLRPPAKPVHHWQATRRYPDARWRVLAPKWKSVDAFQEIRAQQPRVKRAVVSNSFTDKLNGEFKRGIGYNPDVVHDDGGGEIVSDLGQRTWRASCYQRSPRIFRCSARPGNACAASSSRRSSTARRCRLE